MSGRTISIFYSPFEGESSLLVSKVIDYLTKYHALKNPEEIFSTLEYDEVEQSWYRGYGMEEDPNQIPEFVRQHYWICFNADLRSGSMDLHTTIEVHPMIYKTDERPCITFSFGTLLFTNLYPDLETHIAEEDVKQSIIRFCLGVAEAIDAKAFMVDVNDEGILKGIDPVELAKDMVDPDGIHKGNVDPMYTTDGRYVGVLRSFVSKEEIIQGWGEGIQKRIQETTSGYITLDFF